MRLALVWLNARQAVRHGTSKLRLLVDGVDHVVGVHHERLVHRLRQVGCLSRHVLVRAELLSSWGHQLSNQSVLWIEHVLYLHLLDHLLLVLQVGVPARTASRGITASVRIRILVGLVLVVVHDSHVRVDQWRVMLLARAIHDAAAA